MSVSYDLYLPYQVFSIKTSITYCKQIIVQSHNNRRRAVFHVTDLFHNSVLGSHWNIGRRNKSLERDPQSNVPRSDMGCSHDMDPLKDNNI